jgi:hypothetical protein
MDTKEIKELLKLKKKYEAGHDDGIIDNLIQSLILSVIFGVFVMLLWNALMPDLFNFQRIDYLQSVGLIILARLIFGGISFRYRDNRHTGVKKTAALHKLKDIDEWKQYDKFWEEEGKQYFEDYKLKHFIDQ